MVFAPEDKRVWRESEVMAEFEKIAKETDLLNGGPPEAFQPIPETVVASQSVWEDEDTPELLNPGLVQHAQMVDHSLQLMEVIEKMAQELAEVGHIRVAYRLERTLAAIKDIANIGGE